MHRIISSAFLSAFVFALVQVPVAATASAGDGLTSITASGHLRVTTSRTGAIRLEVRDVATLRLDDLRVDGRGLYSGAVLRDALDEFGFRAEVMNLPVMGGWSTGARHQQGRSRPHPGTELTDCRSECRMSPGTYDLYVATDGQPVTVSVRLGGLSGSTLLEESDLTPAFSRLLDGPVEEFGSGGALGSAGGWLAGLPDVPRSGLAFVVATARVGEYSLSRATQEICISPGDGSECSTPKLTQEVYGLPAPLGNHRRLDIRAWDIPPGRLAVQSVASVGGGLAPAAKFEADVVILGW